MKVAQCYNAVSFLCLITAGSCTSDWCKYGKYGGAAVGAVGGAILGPVVAVPAALIAIGFTAPGVAAGSLAAQIHSGIGNVAAKSLFAYAQSAGAAGLGLGGIVASGLVGGAIGGVVGYKLADYAFCGDEDYAEAFVKFTQLFTDEVNQNAFLQCLTKCEMEQCFKCSEFVDHHKFVSAGPALLAMLSYSSMVSN